MDNVKTDNYYIQKIRKDLEFIVEHMKNVDAEELNANACDGQTKNKTTGKNSRK